MAYTHFTRDDRVRLAVLLRAKTERKEIGRILNKNPISIWREIKRNSKNGKYIPSVARKEAKERKTHRNKKIENDEYLKKYILRHKKLKKYLRCQKGKYRRRHGTVLREKQREYGKKRWIGQRPQIINDRARIGYWEGDTIIGLERTKRILTHVERKTGYLIADFLPTVSAEIVAEKISKRFRKLPKEKRRSITYDNGTEFSHHESIENKTKVTVYFANPYHSWERGTNENTNGLLRQFFPKKSSFANITEDDVEKATKLLNCRPRKRLCYLTPKEMFHCTSF